jgi:hypothetical protein
MSGATVRAKSIFAPVTALAFNARQFDDLKEFLVQRSENTAVVPISDAEQLLMAPDGRLAENGYRFNYLGFQALSNGLAGGLSSVFTELTGEHRYRASSEVEPNLQAAVGVFNMVVRSRIDAVRERTLLVDHRERVVEGFLGLNHRMLDNSAFLETVDTEMTARQAKARFQRAELVGRDLRMFYVDPSSQRKDIYSDVRHTIAAGWSFNNSEDRHKAISAVLCLLTRFGPALERPKTNLRMNHVGADLAGRTSILVGKAASREVDMSQVLSQLGKLQTTSLGFIDEPEKFDRVVDHWAAQLTRLGILREDARSIVKNAAMVGADLDPRDPTEVYTRSALGARTAYDLVCSLLRFARDEPARTRDRLQVVAMEMMTPRTKKNRKASDSA